MVYLNYVGKNWSLPSVCGSNSVCKLLLTLAFDIFVALKFQYPNHFSFLNLSFCFLLLYFFFLHVLFSVGIFFFLSLPDKLLLKTQCEYQTLTDTYSLFYVIDCLQHMVIKYLMYYMSRLPFSSFHFLTPWYSLQKKKNKCQMSVQLNGHPWGKDYSPHLPFSLGGQSGPVHSWLSFILAFCVRQPVPTEGKWCASGLQIF